MTLWIIGMLFTYGYVLDDSKDESRGKTLAICFLVVCLWPVILGLNLGKK
jgi:hypothetical protein